MKSNSNLKNTDLLFYTDDYALVSKDNKRVKRISDLKNVTIGALETDIDSIRSSFEDNDTIIYNSYNRVSFGIIKPKRKPMPDSYECKNKDFDYKKTSKELTEKFSRYPVSIKGIVLLIPEYLEGRTDSKTFAKNCNDRTPVLLTRVEMAKDGKEFSHTYQREISLVKSLNDMCFQYNKGIIAM